MLLKWKEEKHSDDRGNNIALNRAMIIEGRCNFKGDLDADDMLRQAAVEIEERASARLKVSLWREQKDKEKEEIMVSICSSDIIIVHPSLLSNSIMMTSNNDDIGYYLITHSITCIDNNSR